MPLFLGRFPAFARALLCLFASVALFTTARAASDTTGDVPGNPPRSSVLFIGHLNFDCVQDTVTGWSDAWFRVLPRAIRWGRPRVYYRHDSATGRVDTLLADSSCGGAPLRGSGVAVTTIRYPAWEQFSGSVAFQRMNPDSLEDMILYIRGSVQEDEARRDTLRPLLIFGQDGLDTLPVLDVAAIDAFQVAPFFAMELRTGSELVEPEVRDLSGVTSYVLQPVGFIVGERDTSAQEQPSPGDSTPAQPIRVRVYPNPTGVAAQLEVASIPPGEYRVEVVAVNGLVYLREDVTVSMTGALFQTLDLHTLPTGYYVVRLSSGNQVRALYPIIITR